MNAPWTRRERLTLLLVVVGGVLWLLSAPLFGDRSTLSMRPDDPRLGMAPWAIGDPDAQAPVNPITPDIDGFVLPGIMRARQLEESVGHAHWDGSQLLGLPFAANMAWPLSSPITWGLPRLYEQLTGSTIDPVTLLDLMLALHLVLALLLAYRACRMLGVEPAFAAAGAVGFAFSTWMFTRWHAPHIVYTTAWWPGQLAALQWLARGHRRRGVLEGGVVTGLMLLSGFPQVGVILTGLTVAVALLDAQLRPPKVFAGVVSIAVLGVALAAPQLVLNKGAFAQSLRAHPDVQASVAERGLPAASLLGAVLPDAFGHPPDFSVPSRPAPTMESWLPQRLFWSHQVQNSAVENALYPGALLLLLLAVLWRPGAGQRARALLFCATLALIGSIVAPILVAAAPGLQQLAAGNVKRALVVVGVSLPLAGALALQALAAGRLAVPWRWGTTLVAVVLVAPVAAFFVDDPESSRYSADLASQSTRQVLLLALGMASLWLLQRYGRWLPSWEGKPAGSADDEAQSADSKHREDEAATPPASYRVGSAERMAGLITPVEPEPPPEDPAIAVGRDDLFRAGRWVRWLPALVLAIDLVSLSHAFNPFPRQIEAFPSTPVLQLLGSREGRVAVFGGRINLLPPTAAALHGIRSLHGVAPMVPTRTAELLACIEGSLLDMRDPRVAEPFQQLDSLHHPLLDLLGVASVAHADPSLAERSGLSQIYASEVEGLAVLDRPTAGPRAFLCAAAEVLVDADERLRRLSDRSFDGHRLALLERDAEIALPDTPGAGLVAASVSGVDAELSVSIEAPHDGVLILTEAWDPGWSVTVDDEPGEVHVVDHALLGVVVSRGAHLVVFRYEPEGLGLAMWLCGAGLAFCLWLIVTVVRFRLAARRAPAVTSQPVSQGSTGDEPQVPQLSPPAVARMAPDLGPFEGHGVSVIIPAYDDTPKLRRAMWSIQQTADMPYELIVSRAKQCVAKNRNAGLALATQDLVIFLDDDVLLPPGWMSRLVAVLGAHRDYGAVCAHLTFADGSPQTRRPDLSPGELWEITIPGTCFVYSRARVHDIRFDENYQGSQWEDTDWMWQVGRQDLKVGMSGDVWVLHDHADSENKWLFPNAEYFRSKWGELPAEDDSVSVSPEGYAGWSQPPLPGTDAVESEPQQEGEWHSRKDRDDEP